MQNLECYLSAYLSTSVNFIHALFFYFYFYSMHISSNMNLIIKDFYRLGKKLV
jgi:hypothetical protein